MTPRIDLLKSVELFSRLSSAALYQVANLLHYVSISAGYQFITKGEPGDCLYIIAEGEVSVHDQNHEFARLGLGKVVGEYSLLDTEQRSANVTTVTDTVLYRLDQVPFFELANRHPEILHAITQLLVNRLRFQNTTIIANLQRREQELSRLVDEKTADLQATNQELQQAMEEVKSYTEVLEITYKEMEEQHNRITDSVRYAQRIQEALLPSLDEIREVFPQAFVLFKPKDIISGDFYWIARSGGYVYLAIADCTGHGVPGALMGSLGISLLNQILGEHPEIPPGNLLMRLDEAVVSQLRQENQVNRDGMDIALIRVHTGTGSLLFSGAYNPLWLFRNGEHVEYPAARRPIGGLHLNHIVFEDHEIQPQPGDSFLMFSDGYADQFGGEDHRKKLSKKKFKELAQASLAVPVDERAAYFDTCIVEWQQGTTQTDDILVFGFDVP
jgi:serine phosphatase RsbU (regulator of sigma subunit)